MMEGELLNKGTHEAFTVDSSVKILALNLKAMRQEEEKKKAM